VLFSGLVSFSLNLLSFQANKVCVHIARRLLLTYSSADDLSIDAVHHRQRQADCYHPSRHIVFRDPCDLHQRDRHPPVLGGVLLVLPLKLVGGLELKLVRYQLSMLDKHTIDSTRL
jgi:hypothetical protein